MKTLLLLPAIFCVLSFSAFADSCILKDLNEFATTEEPNIKVTQLGSEIISDGTEVSTEFKNAFEAAVKAMTADDQQQIRSLQVLIPDERSDNCRVGMLAAGHSSLFLALKTLSPSKLLAGIVDPMDSMRKVETLMNANPALKFEDAMDQVIQAYDPATLAGQFIIEKISANDFILTTHMDTPMVEGSKEHHAVELKTEFKSEKPQK